MNREIRFRIWDSGRKEWVHGPGNEVNLFGEVIIFGELLRRPDDTAVSLDNLNDLVALQYCGLKDKTGKEIYEGDIMSFLGETWTIIYFEPYAAFMLQFGNDLADITTQEEIIGNIYENPELLNP